MEIFCRIPCCITLYHGLATNTGIFVMFIEANSPAHKAGLQIRDVIIGFNGQALANIDELHKILTSEQIAIVPNCFV